MAPYAGLQAHALYDLRGVQAAHRAVGVQLVEVGDAEGEAGVREGLHGLGGVPNDGKRR